MGQRCGDRCGVRGVQAPPAAEGVQRAPLQGHGGDLRAEARSLWRAVLTRERPRGAVTGLGLGSPLPPSPPLPSRIPFTRKSVLDVNRPQNTHTHTHRHTQLFLQAETGAAQHRARHQYACNTAVSRRSLHRRALEQARPQGPLRRERGIHMWAAGYGRDAHSVHSLVVVQTGRKGHTDRSPNIAAVRTML